MKRKLQKMIALLAILFVPFLLSAQEYASILNESFENGIPEGWTQECVSGKVQWVKETGGSYPMGAFDGSARLRFSADTNITTNSVARLVTPNLCKVEEGKVYSAKVVSVEEFGCFVQVWPGCEGLVHVSQLDHKRVNHPSDMLKVGDEIVVKATGYDRKNKFSRGCKKIKCRRTK